MKKMDCLRRHLDCHTHLNLSCEMYKNVCFTVNKMFYHRGQRENGKFTRETKTLICPWYMTKAMQWSIVIILKCFLRGRKKINELRIWCRNSFFLQWNHHHSFTSETVTKSSPFVRLLCDLVSAAILPLLEIEFLLFKFSSFQFFHSGMFSMADLNYINNLSILKWSEVPRPGINQMVWLGTIMKWVLLNTTWGLSWVLVLTL